MLTTLCIFLCLLSSVSPLEQNYDSSSFLEEEQKLSPFTRLDHDDVPEEDQDGSFTLLHFHQWTTFVAWAVLADFGIIANRYGLMIKNKLDVHAIIMSLCVLPSIIAELIAIFAGEFPEPEGEDDLLSEPHELIGFVFLGVMILQMLGGIILKFSIESKNPSFYLKVKSLSHIYFGYAIYLLGKAEVGIGFYLMYQGTLENGNIVAFWVILGLILFWRIIFEVLFLNNKLLPFFFPYQEKPRQRTDTLQDSLLVQYIEQNEQTLINTEFARKQWFLFNNEIVDLTGFCHPGGQYIWEMVKGREVSRFIYGGTGLEDGSTNAYAHSKESVQLLKRHVIGSLNNLPYLVPVNENDQSQNNQWLLSTTRKINDKTSYFGFTNHTFTIASQFIHINSFGKYFQIKSIQTENLPIRQYTCVSCMAPENVEYRSELVKYVERIVATNEFTKGPQQSKLVRELPLLIKCYEGRNGFSQYIHSHNNELYEIEGPYGPPHGIPAKGKIVIICGGTGIFPFLDLLDFMLKTIINQIALTKFGKQEADSLNPFECTFNTNIHITLFFAAANREELVGSDIYFSILKLQKLLGHEYFKLILKIKDRIEGIETTDQRFTEQFFLKHLIQHNDYARYLICGPPPMQTQVPVILRRMGVQEHNIHFV